MENKEKSVSLSNMTLYHSFHLASSYTSSAFVKKYSSSAEPDCTVPEQFVPALR